MPNHRLIIGKYDPETKTLNSEFKDDNKDSKLHSIYGLDYYPHEGSEATLMNQGFDYGSCFSFVDNVLEITPLSEGDVVVGSPLSKSFVLFKADGSVVVSAKSSVTVTGASTITVTAQQPISITAPTVNITGNLTVSGNITSAANVSDSVGTLNALRTQYNGHRHNETNSVTSTPI